MYKPFGKDIKDEMLICIGHDYARVYRSGRCRCFNAIRNERIVRAENRKWIMLMRCGYAELLYTIKNPASGIIYNAYALSEKGMRWLGRQMGLRIIPPKVIEMEYKGEKVC